MEPNPHPVEDMPGAAPASPRHGYQGDRGARRVRPSVPAAVSITISREAGARGGTIGRRVGRKLGWQVYDQELLEHMAQEGVIRQNVVEHLSAEAARWCEERLRHLLNNGSLSQHPPIVNLGRVVLALATQGEVVLVGRGSGCIVPRSCSLNVRILAPLPDRIAYMSQWLRLTEAEAAERVRLRDTRRAEFLQNHFHCQAADVYQYDLLLNSSLLGEELCADLIVQAAGAKQAALDEGMLPGGPEGDQVTR
jgi:cytidylate kinase